MNWYLAKIIYRIVIGNNNIPAQFEEQWRLVSASGYMAAVTKANQLAANECFTLCNHLQQIVAWKFIAVNELVHISDWTDGAEVCSTLTEVPQPQEYLQLIKDKAMILQQQAAGINQPTK